MEDWKQALLEFQRDNLPKRLKHERAITKVSKGDSKRRRNEQRKKNYRAKLERQRQSEKDS